MRLLSIAALFIIASQAIAEVPARTVVNIDSNWSFHTDTEKDWHRVDLPHDWSIHGDYDEHNPSGGRQAYLPCGMGYYRKTLEIQQQWIGKHIEIAFDAAYMNSVVSINGHELGKRPYGFISFGYDLTPYVHAGENQLEVTLDNSKVPSARWYTGSGIYSHVNLVVTSPVRIKQWGTFVTTPDLQTVRVKTEIEGQAEGMKMVYEIRDENGNSIATAETAKPQAGDEIELKISGAKTWSPGEPNLYTIVSKLYSGRELIDETATRFGFRTVKWDANTGFWLNGKNIKLQGVCLHWDQVPFGSAIPDRFIEWRLRMLKEMGCNAIRTGHTPFPPYFYDVCDRLGIMVMDECFDGWHKKAEHDYGQQAFAQWWQRDLHDFIVRDRNHPCVIIWSIGNETGQSDKFEMTKIVHDLDPTRSTTGGQVHSGVDVAGFNGPGESPGILADYHAKHPNQPILLTEEPHTYQTRGFYRVVTNWRGYTGTKITPFPSYGEAEIFFDQPDHQFCSSYDNNTARITARQCWKRTKETPWISGEFRWVGFEYLGEASTYGRHWPLRFAHQGVIDPAGFPKDHFYFYQSQWTSKSMVHLLPHWTHPDLKPGTTVPVVAYSNCDEVELFLNGKSLARQKPRELLDFVWNVPYEPGELKAIAYRDGSEVAQEVIATAGAPDHLDIQADRDLGLVTVRVMDQANHFVPTAEVSVTFIPSDGAKLLGTENGDPEDTTAHRIATRHTFNGLLRAFFAPHAGQVTVQLKSSNQAQVISLN